MTKTNGAQHFALKRDKIPLVRTNNGPRKYDWPFGRMKVGECFYYPITGKGFKAVYNARNVIQRSAREWRGAGLRFSLRLMPGDKRFGVWRGAVSNLHHGYSVNP